MKKSLILFSIFSLIIVTTVNVASRREITPSSQTVVRECPIPTSTINGAQVGKSFTIYIAESWAWAITYTINDAVVLVDENNNVINPSQTTDTPSGKYTLKMISNGEYYFCGGTFDSPPITFGDKPVYYFNTPSKIGYMTGDSPGAPAPKVFDSIYCTYSQFTVKDNGVSLTTIPSKEMTEFSFELDEGSHNIQIKRDIECKYSYYIEDYPDIKSITFIYTPEDLRYPLSEYSSMEISTTVSSPPLTYSLNVDTIGGTCKKGCNSGFVCCRSKCMSSNEGVCKDINGDGISDWVPYTSPITGSGLNWVFGFKS